MAQTCTKCSRANPGEAVYCYFDGFVLQGHSRNGGPVAVGSQAFNSPFVFPTGRSSRSFDELALACQEEWPAARDLLQQGYLENFLGGLGRVDLALAAREAAKFPDHDRGLDQLLAKFPSDVLAEPQLRLEPQEVSLGVVESDRAFDLHLENQGMRLVYGTVSSGDGWLTLGDAPGAAQKHVQFNHELTIPVHVHGDRVRAGNKPVEARLVIETNGGTSTVVVRAERPVKAFPPGVLGGAKSPRQVAEKAKASPKDAAPLFEKGAVAAWYKDNGWTYPVRGPSASGLGAVQQFFEALGLTPPPKVEISEKAVALSGNVGEQLQHALEVKTQEKRPVYAHATSNQPWLEVGRPKLAGRVATINFSVPAIPDRPGETLTAKLTIQSNGNQRFVVPVTLQVGGDLNFGAPVAASSVAIAEAPPPVPAMAAVAAAVVAPSRVEPSRPRYRSVKKTTAPAWVHLLPALLLVVALIGVVAWDLATKGAKAATDEGPNFVDDTPRKSATGWRIHVTDPDPRVSVDFADNKRFGIVMLKEKDPDNPSKFKRLTFKETGSSNNTCIRIDGADFLFGNAPPGRWVGKKERHITTGGRNGYESVMLFPADKVRVTQHVEVLPGEQSGQLDTVLVWYKVKNESKLPRKIGLRMMLDTFIGLHDDVPFVIPGQKGLLDTMKEFSEKEIPDYVEALEYPNPSKPGTVAHLGLKGIHLPGVTLEPIKSMLICGWPGSEQRYDVEKEDRVSIKAKKDSCVFLYWPERVTRPGEERNMAFTYGLGKIAVEDTGGAAAAGGTQVGLSVGGNFRPGGTFTVTAYVKNAKDGEKVKLELPDGLSLADGEEAEKVPEKGDKYSQTSWRVQSTKAGAYTIRATTGGKQATKKIEVRASGIFG